MYIGRQPIIGNFVKLDTITTSATTTFNLTNGGVAYYPQTANNCLVSLNGILQAPTDSYTISGSTIIFSNALTTSDVIDFIIVLGDVLNIGTPSDNTVSLAKLTATGTKNSTTFLRGDNTFATVVSGILQVKKTLITSTISTTCTSSAYSDVSGFSVTITPTSSNSQILLLGLINSSHVTESGQRMRFRLLRGSTDITVPDSSGSRQTGFFTPEYDTDDYECTTGSLTWWDSPATTSATTYKLQVTTNNSSSNVAYINRSRTDSDNVDHVRTVSSIVAIEVSNSIL